jgi:hypothetical protein
LKSQKALEKTKDSHLGTNNPEIKGLSPQDWKRQLGLTLPGGEDAILFFLATLLKKQKCPQVA